MREPTRWLDDPRTDDQLREVLSAGYTVPSLPEQVHSQMALFAGALAAQVVGTQAALGASGLKSLSALLGLHGAGKAIAVVAMMGALGTGSYAGVRYYVTHKTVSASMSVTGSRAVTPVTSIESSNGFTSAASTPAIDDGAIEPTAKKQGLAAPARVSEPHGNAEARRDSTGHYDAGSFDELGIADEARLLESARTLLATQPARALEIANGHERFYPNGQMSAEREFIAVDALMRLGRRGEAEHRAESWLSRSPNGIYARRLRKLLGQ